MQQNKIRQQARSTERQESAPTSKDLWQVDLILWPGFCEWNFWVDLLKIRSLGEVGYTARHHRQELLNQNTVVVISRAPDERII